MRTGKKSGKNCDHKEAVVTTTAGIQRTACMTCGAVSIQYDHPVCTEWPESVTGSVNSDEPVLVGLSDH